MIVIALLLSMQAPDTVGLRQGVHDAVQSIMQATGRQGPLAIADHIVVDVRSFKNVAGVGGTGADWSSVALGAGERGSSNAALRCGSSSCPTLTALRLSRTSDTVRVVIAVFIPGPAASENSDSEYTVSLVRRGHGFVVADVRRTAVM